MKPKTLLILALVVGALAAAVLLFEGDLPSTDERSATAKKVVPVDGADLTAIEVEWEGKMVKLERDAKPAAPVDAKADPAAVVPQRKWRMLEPFAVAADSAAVDTLAGELTSLEVTRELEGVKRADVGLEPARGKITWKTPEKSGLVEIGGKVPAASEVVVAASTRTAPAIVADSIVAQLEKAPGEWRSREVVAAPRGEIERLTLSAPGSPPVALARSGETLRLEAPVADVADREAVDQLLGDLTGLKVETFLDPPLTEASAAAFASPAGTIEMVVKGAAEPVRIEIGGGEPIPGKRLVRVGGQAFVATTKLLDSVTRAALGWRSRHWTRFENWRIERVTIDDAVGKLVLERKDGKWLRDGAEVPFNAASDLLYAITAAKADSIREGGVPADRPLVTLTLGDADGNEEVLTLHAVEGTAQAARVSGRDLTLLLPLTAATDVTSKVGALRAAEPVKPPAAEGTPAAPAADAEPAPGAPPPPPGDGE